MLAALIIVFREMIEAGLIVGIVLTATRGVPGRGCAISFGIAAGVAGACLVALFAGQISTLFAGAGQELFNAAILGIAVLMLTWHNVWMASHGRALAQDLKKAGAEVVAGHRTLAGLAIVVSIAVLREGSEVVLFLYGIALSGGNSLPAMAAGGLLGIAGGAAVSALMYFGLLRIPARQLFSVTSGLISLMAAGLAAQSIAFLQQSGHFEIGTHLVWNSSAYLPENSLLGRLLHTLLGYTDAPTQAQCAIYVLTLAVIGILMLAVQPPPLAARRQVKT